MDQSPSFIGIFSLDAYTSGIHLQVDPKTLTPANSSSSLSCSSMDMFPKEGSPPVKTQVGKKKPVYGRDPNEETNPLIKMKILKAQRSRNYRATQKQKLENLVVENAKLKVINRENSEKIRQLQSNIQELSNLLQGFQQGPSSGAG